MTRAHDSHISSQFWPTSSSSIWCEEYENFSSPKGGRTAMPEIVIEMKVLHNVTSSLGPGGPAIELQAVDSSSTINC